MGQKPRTDIRTDRQTNKQTYRHSWFHSKCTLKRSEGTVDMKSMIFRGRTDRHTKNNTASTSAGCTNLGWWLRQRYLPACQNSKRLPHCGRYGLCVKYHPPVVFSARCNIYISRLCYDVSVGLSVTKCIIANLGFKFRSQFTAHCSRGTCGHEGRDHRREEWRDHLELC